MARFSLHEQIKDYDLITNWNFNPI